jgi:hypothetical protein
MRFFYILAVFCIGLKLNAQPKHLKYSNVVILADLSNRVDNKVFPNKDIKQIHSIIEFFKNECVKPGIKIGDKSVLSFSTFSDNKPIVLDLDKMFGDKLAEKQAYVNSRGKYKNLGLLSNLKKIEYEIKSVYSITRNPGLDLISLLLEKIESDYLIRGSKTSPNGVVQKVAEYENHIFILTDGYLEYSSSMSNKQFYFGANQIQKIRNYCIKNNMDVTSALKLQPSLGLPKYIRKNNALINLHILETHERDKDPKMLVYKNPVGLRDNEILEAVWTKWSYDSNFKSISWSKY